VLTTISQTTAAAQRFTDATNVERTNWPSTEVALAGQTFATTILRLNSYTSGSASPVAHLRVADAAGGGGTTHHIFLPLLGVG
jgi:hypothetical protein